MAKATPKYTVGQQVMATDRFGTHELVVTRVGRLYVYAKRPGFWNERKFNIENRHEATEYSNGGAIFTLEEWADRTARAEAVTELKNLGLQTTWSGVTAFEKATSTQLRAIIDILKGAAGTPTQPPRSQARRSALIGRISTGHTAS